MAGVLRIATVLGLCFFAGPAFGGMISSGGGEAVQLANGQIRFLDMVSTPDLRNTVAPERLASVVSPRCVRSPASSMTLDRRGVDAILKGLKRHHVRIGFALEYSVEQVLKKVVGVDFDLRPLKIFSDSARVPAAKQFPVGAFGGSYLVVNRAAYAALPQNDKDAFLMHEAMREYASFFDAESGHIKLADIETAVPLVTGSPFSPQIPRLLKQKELLENEYTIWDFEFDQLAEERSPERRAAWAQMFFEMMDRERKDHAVEDLAVSCARQKHELAARLAELGPGGNPEHVRLLRDLQETYADMYDMFIGRYRSGLDPKVRLKMLEFEVAIGTESAPGEVFDTVDFVWRKPRDPVCAGR